MKLKAVTSVKYNGEWLNPGTVFECADKDAKSLIANGGAKSLGIDAEDTKVAVKNLCKIEGVNKKIAQLLINANVDTVEKVSAMEVADLASIEGIDKSTAEKIYNSFIPDNQ